MLKSRYSSNLYSTLLVICLFLFHGIVFGFLSGCAGKSKQAMASHESADAKRGSTDLPKIGQIITTERALELCDYYGFNHLAERIEVNPDLYKEWEFDGCSMIPDAVISEIIEVPSLTEICLRHDLGYAYGDPNNEEERLIVDKKFQNELLRGGAGKFTAEAMFDAVRIGGKEELCLPFSWGFTRVETCKPGVGLQLKQ